MLDSFLQVDMIWEFNKGMAMMRENEKEEKGDAFEDLKSLGKISPELSLTPAVSSKAGHRQRHFINDHTSPKPPRSHNQTKPPKPSETVSRPHRQNVQRQTRNHGPSPPTSRPLQRPSPRRKTQRTLLRALRPETWLLAILDRDNLLHALHGEVHGGVEYGVEAVSGTCAEGGWEWAEFWRTLRGDEGREDVLLKRLA